MKNNLSSSKYTKRIISTIVFTISMVIISLSLATMSLTRPAGATGSSELSLGVNTVISMSITGNTDGTECTEAGFNSCSTFGNLLPNQYASSSSLISVYTNSSDGYSLSVKVDNSNNNNANLRTADNNHSIPAGTLTSETGGQGVWSYKTDGTGIKTNWTPMTTTDTTIKGTSIYSATTSDTTVTYGLSTSNNQAAGDYSTTLIYTATAPNSTDIKEPTLTINLGEGIYGAQIKTDTLAGESTGLVTISEDGTIRTGTVKINTDKNYYIIPLYESGYTLNTITPTGGTITQDNDNSYGYYYYTPNANVDNIITITSKTLPAEITATSGSNLTAMQSINSSNASSYCPAVPTAVKDNRDDSVYYIQTLADGNCWMLENLRLGGSSTMELNSSNTNLAANTTFTLPASGTDNFTNNAASYTTATLNAGSKETTVTGWGAGRNLVGNYYNYCAASAGTICTTSNDEDDEFNICPVNWTMPSGHNGQYIGLYRALSENLYGSDSSYIVFRYVFSATLSGRFSYGAKYNQGVFGGFWSSTSDSVSGRVNSGASQFLYVVVDHVYPRNYLAGRYDGYSVRCVLR